MTEKIKTVCLIGFMGSGKTTVGSALARSLDFEWIDLDPYIENKLGLTIPEAFSQKGEDYFRAQEAIALKEVLSRKESVISTGGGIISLPNNIELLKTQYTYYLKYSLDTLYNRINGDKNRPLAKSYEEIKALFIKRQSLYEAASTVTIEAEHMSVEEITDCISKQIIFHH